MKTIVKVALLTILLSGTAYAEHKQGYGSQVNNNRVEVPELDVIDIGKGIALLISLAFLLTDGNWRV